MFTVQGPFYVEQLSIGPNGERFGVGQTKVGSTYGIFTLDGSTPRKVRTFAETTYGADHTLGSIASWEGGQ